MRLGSPDNCTCLYRSLQELQSANIVALAWVLPLRCNIILNVTSGDNRADWGGAELFRGREHMTQQVTHWTRINLLVLNCGISAAQWTTVVGFFLGLNANACLQGLGWDCRDQLLSSHWNKAPPYSWSHCEITASSGFKWKDQSKKVSLCCHYTPTSCGWHP